MISKKSLVPVLDKSIILTITAPNDNAKSISVQCGPPPSLPPSLPIILVIPNIGPLLVILVIIYGKRFLSKTPFSTILGEDQSSRPHIFQRHEHTFSSFFPKCMSKIYPLFYLMLCLISSFFWSYFMTKLHTFYFLRFGLVRQK